MGIEGKKILITKAYKENDEFVKNLESCGAKLIRFPVIEIKTVEKDESIEKILNNLDNYTGIFFTSVNAVKIVFDSLEKKSLRYNGDIYVVGGRTEEMARSYGYEIKSMPEKFSAGGLFHSLYIHDIRGKKFLFPCGNLALNTLPESLKGICEVDKFVVYETVLPAVDLEFANSLERQLNENEILCIVFFSPSSIDNFLKIFSQFKQNNTDIAVMGITTLERAMEKKLKVNIIPENSSVEKLINAILEYYK